MCNKNSCSVKLQDGSFDYSPGKIPVEVFVFNEIVDFLKKYTVLKTTSNFIKKSPSVLAISCQAAVSQNNSHCLLLNILINVTQNIFQFVK